MTDSRKLVVSFSSCNFLFSFTSWMVFYYLPLYLKNLGFPDERIGILIGIFSLTTLFLVAFFGLLSDKFSPRRLLQLGVVLFLVCLSGLYFLSAFINIFILLISGVLNGNFGYKPPFIFSGLLVVFLSLYLFPRRRIFDRVLSG